MGFVLFKGILMGLLIALPTGGVSFLIIRRFYLFGMKSGMYSVLGSMLSDLFYASIVGFGLGAVGADLIHFSVYAELIVGASLMFVGYRAYRETARELKKEEHNPAHPIKDFSSVFALNILNPALIVSFSVLYLALGMHHAVGHPKLILIFLLGTVLGTIILWYGIARAIIFLRHKNRFDMTQKINKITGIVLLVTGLTLVVLSVTHIITK